MVCAAETRAYSLTDARTLGSSGGGYVTTNILAVASWCCVRTNATPGCAYDDTETARMFYTTTLCVDTALLLLMLFGLVQLSDAKKHGLWKFLWLQVRLISSSSVIVISIGQCAGRILGTPRHVSGDSVGHFHVAQPQPYVVVLYVCFAY